MTSFVSFLTLLWTIATPASTHQAQFVLPAEPQVVAAAPACRELPVAVTEAMAAQEAQIQEAAAEPDVAVEACEAAEVQAAEAVELDPLTLLIVEELQADAEARLLEPIDQPAVESPCQPPPRPNGPLTALCKQFAASLPQFRLNPQQLMSVTKLTLNHLATERLIQQIEDALN